MRGKKGVEPISQVFAVLLLFLGPLGLLHLSPTSVGQEIQERFFPQWNGIFCDAPIFGNGCGATNQSATLENSYISQIAITGLSLNESYSTTVYTPLQTPDLNIQVAMLTIEWSGLGNLNENVSFASAMASPSRRYFVNIGGNVVGLNNTQYLVDPINDTHCQTTVDDADMENGYFCVFPYHIPQTDSNRANTMNAVDITVTSANHARRIALASIEPLDRPSLLTTVDRIIETTWQQILFLYAIVKKIYTYGFYFTLIGFGLIILWVLGKGAKALYHAIAGD